MPLTGLIDPEILIEGGGTRSSTRATRGLREQLFRAVLDRPLARVRRRTACKSCCAACRASRRREHSATTNVFRVIIMQFIDAHAFDVRSIKKTCVHIVHPDGRLIPFDTYNLFYRDDLERTRLAPLRAAAERAALG